MVKAPFKIFMHKQSLKNTWNIKGLICFDTSVSLQTEFNVNKYPFSLKPL